MKTTYSFFVDGKPATKGSWRPIARKTGGVFLKPDNANERPWANAVAWVARQHKCQPIVGAVRVGITFLFVKPKHPANGYPVGDVDKLSRSCLDALTGICWANDSAVSDLRVNKAYAAVGENPGAHIWIEAV